MNSERKKIMVVDDNVTNLTIARNILMDSFDVFSLPGGKQLFGMLAKLLPDLILLDVEMPEMSGYDVIKQLKADKLTANIPVIFLSAKTDSSSELEGLSLGAVDYVTKPFVPQLLTKRIELHLLVESQRRELENYNTNLKGIVREKTDTVLQLQNAVLQTVAELVECRDDITGGHIERTQLYLQLLVDSMVENNIYQDEVSTIYDEFFLASSQLHDVGKIMIEDSILKKPGKLSFEEFEQMKLHTVYGVQIVDKISEKTKEKRFLDHARIFAGTHHEKWDGSGYPNGLNGTDIPLHGRLMALADVYDALISERPYKKAFSHEEAVQIIKDSSGTHFDPLLVKIFVSQAFLLERVSDNIQVLLPERTII